MVAVAAVAAVLVLRQVRVVLAAAVLVAV